MHKAYCSDGRVVCQECGGKYKDLNLHIYYQHEFDTAEYGRKYPEAPMKSKDLRKKHSNKAKKQYISGNLKTGASGADNPYWKGGKQSRECCNCTTSVKRHPSEFKDKVFCDKGCEAEWKSNNLSGTDKVGNFEGYSHTQEHKEYISELLRGRDHNLNNNPNWKGGKSFDPYPSEFNEELKEEIRDRDGRQCKLCGKKEDKLDYKLDVHHIDYVKNNINQANLISLCRSCHSKTNSNRVVWTCLFRLKIF